MLRYLKRTLNYGLKFYKKKSTELQGYSDSNWASCLDDSCNTIGFCVSLENGMFAWNYKKQEVVAQSSIEVKHITIASTLNHVLWLRKFLSDLGFNQTIRIVLKVDNQFAIAIAKNPIQHDRTKHIRIKFHVIREVVKNQDIIMEYCDIREQIDYFLTKNLSKDKFITLRTKLGVTKLHLKLVC